MDKKQKALFLDRDGVINIEKNYLYKIEDFEFVDGVFEALLYAQSLGYKIFIITNQSGINRGYYSDDDFHILTNWMIDSFKEHHIDILDIQYCPHTPDENCNCRKPKTGMIDNILTHYNIDLEKSWLIGDKFSDIQCAKNANIKNTIQVRSGHTFDKSEADFIIDKLDKNSIVNIIK